MPVLKGLERLITRAESDVLKERTRQVTEKGFTPKHDDEHVNGPLAAAAACYAYTSLLSKEEVAAHADALYEKMRGFASIIQTLWPWQPHWFKARGDRSDLVRAAALLIAEIERRDRLEGQEPTAAISSR